MATKTEALKSLRDANGAGRTATLWMVDHGHRTTWSGVEGKFVPVTDEQRAHDIEQAVRWSRQYARLADRAALLVEAWARSQGWRDNPGHSVKA